MKEIGKKSNRTLAAALAREWAGHLVPSMRAVLTDEITDLLHAVEMRARGYRQPNPCFNFVHRTFDPPSEGDTYTLCGIRVLHGLKTRIKVAAIPQEITCPDCINH